MTVESPALHVRNLTKRYGRKVALDDLTFDVVPGRVTGFLGPNGAGKSTTIRTILGLHRADSGEALIGEVPYRRLARPLALVGAHFDGAGFHPGRTAFQHLSGLAASQGMVQGRVGEVLRTVGLEDVSKRRVGTYSFGMAQRLGVAAALLGDPRVIMLDEPFNGLDTEGIIWIRDLLRQLADEGRTVFVSSHLMNEMARTVDHLIVIGAGRLVADCPTSSLVELESEGRVLVRSPQPDTLTGLIELEGGTVVQKDGELSVAGLSTAHIAETAAKAGIVIHELTPRRASLEEAYLKLTRDAVEYRGNLAPTSLQNWVVSSSAVARGSDHTAGDHQ